MNNVNTSSVKYVTENKTMVKATIDGTEMFVPIDPANAHYIEIQKWVAEGNTIEEAD